MTTDTTRHLQRLLAVAAAGTLTCFQVAPAFAAHQRGGTPTGSRGNANGKQTICHATRSTTNPYVVITPNKNGDVDGHARHTGPIWSPDLKARGLEWGDIIPPFDYNNHGTPAHYPGMNWTAEGRAWFANGCRAPITAVLVKTNDADRDGTFEHDETAPAAGSAVTFQVVVTNTSAVTVVVDALSDVSDGATIPFACAPQLVGTSLPAGGSATCRVTLTGYAPGAGSARANTVTATFHQLGNARNSGTARDTSVVRTPAAVTTSPGASATPTPPAPTSPAPTSPAPTSPAPTSPAPTTPGPTTTAPTPPASPRPSTAVTSTPTASPTASPTATSSAVAAPALGNGTITLSGPPAVTTGAAAVRAPSRPVMPFTGGGGAVSAPTLSARGRALPFTGAPVTLMAGSALLGIVVGGLLLAGTRRRRTA